MHFDHKISDLKFHIPKLLPVNSCKYFIDFYKNNSKYSEHESSFKYKTKQIEEDNYKCMNLTKLSLDNKNFLKPLELAKMYISIMVTNYVLYIKNNICSTFDSTSICRSSNIRILKYKQGNYIKDHSDVGDLNRASCTLNLNEDYEGGEFRFFNGRIKESFKTGDAMLFPAEPIWIHGTEPITKGTRYSINCFLHSKYD